MIYWIDKILLTRGGQLKKESSLFFVGIIIALFLTPSVNYRFIASNYMKISEDNFQNKILKEVIVRTTSEEEIANALNVYPENEVKYESGEEFIKYEEKNGF